MKLPFIVLILLFSIAQTSLAQNFKSCDNPFPICEKKTYFFSNLNGFGKSKSNLENVKCSNNFEETNSIWLEWKSFESGTLTFTVNPSFEDDDIDFILYKKHQDCNSLEEIRCMASGITYGSNNLRSKDCNGATGLSSYSIDDFEKSGCKFNDDNFLKYLSMEEGEEFILLVNNYDSPSGVSISFECNGELEEIEGCAASNLHEQILVTQLFPNPSSEEINIEFISPSENPTKLALLSITGEVIKELVTTPKIGLNLATFRTEELAANTYLIRIVQVEFSTVKQFVKQ